MLLAAGVFMVVLSRETTRTPVDLWRALSVQELLPAQGLCPLFNEALVRRLSSRAQPGGVGRRGLADLCRGSDSSPADASTR